GPSLQPHQLFATVSPPLLVVLNKPVLVRSLGPELFPTTTFKVKVSGLTLALLLPLNTPSPRPPEELFSIRFFVSVFVFPAENPIAAIPLPSVPAEFPVTLFPS